MIWACGLTTVTQRRADLLPATLSSLRAGGFDEIKLFLDGGDHQTCLDYERQFKLPVVGRWPALRTFGNWVLALAELYISRPNADRYAMFQDDFVCYRNLRGYLSKLKYPDPTLEQQKRANNEGRMPSDGGYWNLFTFPSNDEIAPTVGKTGRKQVGFYKSNQLGRGAVALVFSRLAVTTLLTSYQHIIDRPQQVEGHRRIDGGIVGALRKAGWHEYVHNPSLVQHVGLRSTMGNKPHPLSPSWREEGEGFDALHLLEEARNN